jgi:hypothetical protein
MIFGRVKNVLSFAEVFCREVRKSAGEYAILPDDVVAEAHFEELQGWDKDTSVGEAFWSSVSSCV